ncbi:uncharacterized protein BCR38DRAFT_410567 [Pseudomassariella vexata]|uniref:D-xylose 1-dehydrogenase (NADP(+), D-xylono-1,5-lactone-forming) n=1 Tax=Pseudomassariella vexata TaxID=1141098 RepID=A0A1Y2DS61_9PEZI|nr:uncharacterized protein BCR38DRAFT_410567 [Pseudomassariella vexata]ORY62122.1 hypothetical protein BCR38DRAFT_410567 [Pseudomassariella vexata]
MWITTWLGSIPGFVSRIYTLFRPPRPAKSSNAIRLGLFGASKIGPLAVINPALSHPDVIVVAVAARDRTKAEAYAKKWDIPIVHDSYDDLLADPSIDAVYIPLPNSLHAEWALKSLKAGKHVLLEKPSASNNEEARMLFESPILFAKNENAMPPVLLEAFHYRFHPAFDAFKSLIGDKPEQQIEHVWAKCVMPWALLIPFDDIRFKYQLAGGATMDIGTYAVSWLRNTFGAEPEECISAKHALLPEPYIKDEPSTEIGMKAAWRFPGGAIGEINCSLSSWGESTWLPGFIAKRLPTFSTPHVIAQLKEVTVPEDPEVKLVPGKEHRVKRTVSFWMPLFPTIWHRINIDEVHTIRDSKSLSELRRWRTSRSVKEYKISGRAGEAWWSTYRYQLEEFVNAVKGRPGSGVWVSHENSIKQMRMIDCAYKKAGLPLRPTTEYKS